MNVMGRGKGAHMAGAVGSKLTTFWSLVQFSNHQDTTFLWFTVTQEKYDACFPPSYYRLVCKQKETSGIKPSSDTGKHTT